MNETIQIRVLDLDCPTCAGTVKRALKQLSGVEHVEVHYTTGRVEVKYDSTVADLDDFESTIEGQGYTPRLA